MRKGYRDGLSEAEKKGWRLTERVNAISKAHGLDTRMSLERFVAETMLWAMTQTGAPAFCVKGGILHDQRVRATSDADIVLGKRRTASTLKADMDTAASFLAPHGLAAKITGISDLDIGGTVDLRVGISCELGGTRVMAQLDVGFGSLPEGAQVREFKSLWKGPAFTAFAQPLEAQVADKLTAILFFGRDNTRLKDYADLVRLRGEGLDNEKVAKALYAKLREHRMDTSALLGIPDGLDVDFAFEGQKAWQTFAAGRDVSSDFLEMVCAVRHFWTDIRSAVLDLNERGELEPQRAVVEAPTLAPDMSNVVSLAEYRPRMRA